MLKQLLLVVCSWMVRCDGQDVFHGTAKGVSSYVFGGGAKNWSFKTINKQQTGKASSPEAFAASVFQSSVSLPLLLSVQVQMGCLEGKSVYVAADDNKLYQLTKARLRTSLASN